MHSLRSILFLFISLWLFSGCATPRVAVTPDVWKQKKDVIGVAIAAPPENGIAGYGGWMAFFNPMSNPKSRMSKMLEFFKTVDLSTFDNVADEFVKQLKNRNMRVKRIPDYIDLNAYKAIDNSYNFSALAKTEKIDAIIVLKIEAFGTWDSYIFNKPIGKPKIGIQPLGFMVNFKENGTVFQKDGIQGKKWLLSRSLMQDSKTVEEEWDQPPSFPNMHKTYEALMIEIKKMLVDDFFKQDVQK
jgi:hypothetical protein